jgi:hypothetical protein
MRSLGRTRPRQKLMRLRWLRQIRHSPQASRGVRARLWLMLVWLCWLCQSRHTPQPGNRIHRITHRGAHRHIPDHLPRKRHERIHA